MRGTGRGLTAVVLVVWLAAGAGCQQQEDTSDDGRPLAPQAGGTVVIAFPAEPDVLNSLIRSSAYSGQIVTLLESHLLAMGEDLQWYPDIATGWTYSPDSLQVTFRLRPWRWSDGHSLTAYDVAASFRLFTLPEVASPRRGMFAPVTLAVAVDSATVRYEFQHRVASPLNCIWHAILPLHKTATLDPAAVRTWPLNEQPLSSGSFVLERWDRNRELVLVRNDLFPGTPAYLERLIFSIIPDKTGRVIALETGAVDFVEGIPMEAARRLEKSGRIAIHRISGRDFGYLLWNFRNPLFADRRVRKALSLAIDRQRIIDSLLGGYARPAASPLPPALWAHNAAVAADPFDPQRARELLAEAGWEEVGGDGILEREGLPLAFEILTRQGDPVRANGVVIIRENLRAVGVAVQPRVLEHATAISMVKQGRFDAYLGLRQANLTGDPSPQIHSQATDRFNYGRYSNAQVDSLIDLGLTLADRARAGPVWDRLQEIVAEDQPMAFLYYPETLCGVSRRVRGVRPHMLSPFNNISEWWIAPADRKYAAPIGRSVSSE